MLLTIHNLPSATRYADIKSLLQSKCGLQHVILDNLVGDGAGKKVTVGVAEDADAAILTRKINGLYWNGQQLYVEDVRQQKNASEQPFRSTNPQLEESPLAFGSMNLHQHSSFNSKGMGAAPNMLTSAVQPMMAAMYYVPDYTQSGGYGQVGNYMQGQNYEQGPQKVQSAYMGISGFSQASLMTQVGMAPQINKNLHEFSKPENQSSGWRDDYNEKQDFAAERPLFGQRSPDKSHTPDWIPNQQNRRHQSPPREHSRDNREQWAPRGSDNRGPTQPDFRPNVRPDDRSGFNKPRPDFRLNDRPRLLENSDFESNDQERRNQFSENQHEFSGRPNQRQGRVNEREAFSERPRDFSERSNERPNDFGRPNVRQRRPNEHQGRANEYQRNEFFERRERPNDRPGPPRPDRSEFDHSNGREFRRSDNRPEFSRRDFSDRFSKPNREHPKSAFPRKRKFDERFEGREVERPEQHSHITQRREPRYYKPESPTHVFESEAAKEKFSKKMFHAGLRRIMFELLNSLVLDKSDTLMRQRHKKVISDRLNNIYKGRRVESSIECYESYRELYPTSQDQATYDKVLEEAANEALEIKTEEAVKLEPKPKALPKPPPPKLTKSAKNAKKKFIEAKQLLSQGKVPTFPQGDKKIVAQQKKEDKEGYIPDVASSYKVAIAEELNNITDLFVHELNNAPNATQQEACDTVDQAQFTDDLKMVLSQSISRRVLDSGLKVIRIYGHPRLPRREVLEKFLIRYGAQSLRKSVKSMMYTAAVDTFKNHDRLCSMEPVTVADGITLSFKPMTVVWKRADQNLLRVMRKKIVDDMIDKSDLNLLDKDWPAKEAEIKEKLAVSEAAEAQKKEEEAKKMAEAAQKKAEDDQNKVEDQNKAEEDQNKAEEDQNKTDEDQNKAEDVSDIPNDVENVNLTEVDETIKDATNDYLVEDFHIIDEVNETDSDVEYAGGNEVVNLDETNDGNKNEIDGNFVVIENDIQRNYASESVVEIDDDENDEFSIIENNQDDVDIDNIDDVNDDDLEDY